MRRFIIGKVLLAGALMLTGVTAWGQQPSSPAVSKKPVSIDLAVTYAPERAQTAPGNCCFWFQGGGLDAVASYSNGWGIAAAITGEHASNVGAGADVNKVSFLAGPRYTGTIHLAQTGRGKGRTLQIFGEGLLGAAHAFNTTIVSNPNIFQTSDNVFALQLGGGFNLTGTGHFGIRLLQVDYVRTALPNNSSNSQDDLHLGIGATYHFGLR